MAGALMSLEGAASTGATMSHMETIGVRELRRDASRWLARVRAGETFIVTDRGRPVAQLAPLAADAGYASLIASGQLARGTDRPLQDVLDELDADLPAPERTSGSAVLAELRHGER